MQLVALTPTLSQRERELGAQWNIVSPADFLELISRHLEQLRPGLAMRVPCHLQMRLEAQKSAISMPPRIHHNGLDLPVALAGRHNASIAQLRVFHVDMNRVGF